MLQRGYIGVTGVCTIICKRRAMTVLHVVWLVCGVMMILESVSLSYCYSVIVVLLENN
jgi:hypothetical protein